MGIVIILFAIIIIVSIASKMQKRIDSTTSSFPDVKMYNEYPEEGSNSSSMKERVGADYFTYEESKEFNPPALVIKNEELKEQEISRYNIKKDFSLRDAVIYSEILSPKYKEF